MFASHGLRYLSCELEKRRACKLAASSPTMPDPVFIVGHWRSGTTLLANLLSFDKGYFYPTLVEAVSPHDFFPSPIERLSRRVLPLMFPQNRPMDRANVPLREPFPQEDEMAMAALGAPSFFNALYFPTNAKEIVAREVFFHGMSDEEIDRWRGQLEAFHRKLALLNPGKIPLVKNPAHSARMLELHRIFPEAQFVLMKRQNEAVERSMKSLFEQLWPLLALQAFDRDEIPDLVKDIQQRMEARIARDWQLLPEGSRIEIEFEDLVSNPHQSVDAVQSRVGRQMTDAHRHSITDYMLENASKRD